VAKQYGLQLVRRLTPESLNRRIVVYRIPDSRAVADVVAALKADQRVSSAQANVRYSLAAQQPPGAEVSNLEQPADPKAKQEKARASRGNRKIALPAREQTRPQERLEDARRTRTVKPTPAMKISREQASLVAGNHAALRWPTAGEPFVNLGLTNK
jgi:hypothetical protein